MPPLAVSFEPGVVVVLVKDGDRGVLDEEAIMEALDICYTKAVDVRDQVRRAGRTARQCIPQAANTVCSALLSPPCCLCRLHRIHCFCSSALRWPRRWQTG